MKLEDLQRSLDLRKWHDSEDNAIDMCRHYDYCVFCKFEADFPCARAFNRFEQSKTLTFEVTNIKIEEAKPAAKKATSKSAAKKPATAKKEAPKATATKPATKKPAAKKEAPKAATKKAPAKK